MRRFDGAALFAVLGMVAILAATRPAGAQTSSDTPGGGCVRPVTELMVAPVAPATVNLWGAVSVALRQQISLGFWRWMPLGTDPAVRIDPNLLTPRRSWSRVGGLIRP